MRIRRAMLLAGSGALAGLGLILVGCTPAAPSVTADPARGRYVFTANGGCGCHGPNLAGYRAGGPPELPESAPFGEIFAGPFGSVPARNITPDKATGVGDWSDEQLIRAIRDGVDSKGQRLFPIMPYSSFHFMADGDVRDLVAYLRTVPAVSNQVPARTLNGDVPPSPKLPAPPATAPTTGIDRGRYLATAIGICGDCHTPQTPQGGPDTSRFLAGGVVPRAEGRFQVAPNITPEPATGIGRWSEQQIVTLLKTGARPDGSKVGGLMALQVAGGYDQLSDADARAITRFVKSIPAVSNVPKPPQ